MHFYRYIEHIHAEKGRLYDVVVLSDSIFLPKWESTVDLDIGE